MKIDINWGLVFDNLQWSLTEELKRRAPTHDGDLRKSIKAAIKDQTLIIYAIRYAPYVDKGTKPHMPPVDDIRDWCVLKGIEPEAAWAIALKIKEQGTRPPPFIRPYVDERLVKDLKKHLQVAFK